jgi:transposase
VARGDGTGINLVPPTRFIEEECKLLQLDFEGITEKRQAESLPLLQAFWQWLEATLPQTIPKTPIYKAINYALKNYNGLVQYTSDGMLCKPLTRTTFDI